MVNMCKVYTIMYLPTDKSFTYTSRTYVAGIPTCVVVFKNHATYFTS